MQNNSILVCPSHLGNKFTNHKKTYRNYRPVCWNN